MNEASDLPRLTQGWVWTRLIDACQYIPTGVPAFEGKIEYYSTGSIGKDYCVPEGTYSFIKRPSRANRIAQEGDVLQARMRETNKALLIGNKFSGKLFSTGFFQVRPFDCSLGMAPYLYLYVQSLDFLRQRDTLATGSTQVALTDSAAQRIYFPLAPLKEQHRIVAKIEELFTGLDAGVEALKKIKTQLKRYRQAVLKHAFEGKLTAEWRQAHKHELEPASVLLERIREQRRKTAKGKYKQLPPLDTSDLPELPTGWMWVKLGEIGDVSGGLTKNAKRCAYQRQLPYLRVANVYANKLVLNEIANIGVADGEINRVLLKAGDMLVVEGNGSIEQIGRVALWNGAISPCVHQNHIIKVRFSQDGVGPYALRWLLSDDGRSHIMRLASSTSGLYTLSISKVSALPVPLSPEPEHDKIVEEIERRFSIADEVEKTVDHSLKQAERLRHSILKRAFEGKLVPQNLSDESAEKLLERIREERAKQQATAKSVGARRPKEAQNK